MHVNVIIVSLSNFIIVNVSIVNNNKSFCWVALILARNSRVTPPITIPLREFKFFPTIPVNNVTTNRLSGLYFSLIMALITHYDDYQALIFHRLTFSNSKRAFQN